MSESIPVILDMSIIVDGRKRVAGEVIYLSNKAILNNPNFIRRGMTTEADARLKQIRRTNRLEERSGR